MVEILNVETNLDNECNDKREVILIVGVNGVGKTTSIGKITKLYKNSGKKVLLCAADTFRAGAIEQLNIWANRNNVDIVLGRESQDPSSVIYEATKNSKTQNMMFLFVILLVDCITKLILCLNLKNE